jgi:hypothetical protein
MYGVYRSRVCRVSVVGRNQRNSVRLAPMANSTMSRSCMRRDRQSVCKVRRSGMASARCVGSVKNQ